jgi:hypothetical protein
LEQLLLAAHGKADAEVARYLYGLELTERFSTIKLSQWDKQLPGRQSRIALVALADESAFLDLPPADIPTAPTPDLATQQRMIALTVDHITKGLQVPDFVATRITNSFQDEPVRLDRSQAESFRLDAVGGRPLKFVDTDHATILYVKGWWEVHSNVGPSAPNTGGIDTSVRLGPILGTVMLDAAHHALAWSHWEQGAAGPEAVFTYAVPREESHYLAEYCCVFGKDGEKRVPFEEIAAYHGQIAVDPSNGTTLRLVLRADPKLTDPFVVADVAVEYGPVKVGGKTYICPVKSIALSFGLPVRSKASDDKGELQTMLNDVAFEKYHRFRIDESPQSYNWSWTQAIPGP